MTHARVTDGPSLQAVRMRAHAAAPPIWGVHGEIGRQGSRKIAEVVGRRHRTLHENQPRPVTSLCVPDPSAIL